MFTLLKRALWLPLCLAMVLPASALQVLPGQTPATPGNGNTAAADPLGRNTPSGTLYGFLQAAQSGNYSIAAQYLQMSAARRQSQGVAGVCPGNTWSAEAGRTIARQRGSHSARFKVNVSLISTIVM